MFQLTAAESENLRSQIAISSWGGRRYQPFVFTEYGAIQAAREFLSSNKELARQLEKLEQKIASHDQAIAGILKAIRELMNPPASKSRPIGFTANIDEQGS